MRWRRDLAPTTDTSEFDVHNWGSATEDEKPRTLAHFWLDDEGQAGRLGLPGSGSDFTVFAHHLLVKIAQPPVAWVEG